MKMFHATANNVKKANIFTRKVRVSWLTKNPNGHLFHIYVNCLFFFVCFCFFFLDRFKIQSSHLQNYNFRDTLERFFQCYVMDKASCRSKLLICSQLSMTFFWKIVSYIFETIEIIVFLLYLHAFLLPSVINFTEDIYSLSGLWWSKVYLALKWWWQNLVIWGTLTP